MPRRACLEASFLPRTPSYRGARDYSDDASRPWKSGPFGAALRANSDRGLAPVGIVAGILAACTAAAARGKFNASAPETPPCRRCRHESETCVPIRHALPALMSLRSETTKIGGYKLCNTRDREHHFPSEQFGSAVVDESSQNSLLRACIIATQG